MCESFGPTLKRALLNTLSQSLLVGSKADLSPSTQSKKSIISEKHTSQKQAKPSLLTAAFY